LFIICFSILLLFYNFCHKNLHIFALPSSAVLKPAQAGLVIIMLCKSKKTKKNFENKIGLRCRIEPLTTFFDFPNFSGWNFAEAVSRFNANIAYSGLIHAVTQEVKNSFGRQHFIDRRNMMELEYSIVIINIKIIAVKLHVTKTSLYLLHMNEIVFPVN
jgi:hypothetical protein